MTRDEFCKCHWDYYMVLEKDFLETERYLTIDLGDNNLYDGNTPTDFGNSMAYSVEFIKQYQAVCSEVDVIMKSICTELGGPNAENIKQYAATIFSKPVWKDIINQKVKVKEIELQPFRNWYIDQNTNQYISPDWWTPYNKVKHERLTNLKKANLKNVINALAGLYVLGNYLVKHIADATGNLDTIDVPNENSKLFEMVNWQTVWEVTGKDQYPIPTHQINRMFEQTT